MPRWTSYLSRAQELLLLLLFKLSRNSDTIGILRYVLSAKDDREKYVKTDEWFYVFFRRFPEQLLRLAGLPSSASWHMESVTVKSTEKRIDGLQYKLDERDLIVFAEFQGYWDPMIYFRLYREIMTWYETQKGHPPPFLALTLFLDSEFDPGDPPVDPHPPNRFLKFLLEEALERVGSDMGPLVVLRPIVVPDIETALHEAGQWRQTLEELNLPEIDVTFLKEQLKDIIMRRFTELSSEEVAAMFHLAPLEESRAVQELVARGLEKGKQKWRQVGRQEGRLEGRLIGQIQVLESLLGQTKSPQSDLLAQSPEALKRMDKDLKERVIKMRS